jgi:hypothetical protein
MTSTSDDLMVMPFGPRADPRDLLGQLSVFLELRELLRAVPEHPEAALLHLGVEKPGLSTDVAPWPVAHPRAAIGMTKNEMSRVSRTMALRSK